MARSLERGLAPLVLATMTSQALLVVLVPTIVAIGRDLDAPVPVVGQARSVTAVVSVAAALLIVRHADALGVRRLVRLGAGLTFAACGLVATAQTVSVFLAAHALVGLSFAVLLSSGFAGVAAFPGDRRAAATGLVAGANALAWIGVNPLAAALTEWWSWRAAQAVPAVIGLAALATAGRVAEVPPGSARPSVWTPLRVRPARRWILAEVAAYAAWAALLTFAGAFFIERLQVRESVAGWLLAAGAAAYFAAATRSGQLAARVPAPQLVVGSALVMAVLSVVLLTMSGSVAMATGVFCLVGLAAGIRTPASAALALDQLPGQPGAMMAARTAATQLGYLVGAAVGGVVIAGPGFPMLGLALAACLTVSAWLVLTIHDPPTPASAPVTRTANSRPSSPLVAEPSTSRTSYLQDLTTNPNLDEILATAPAEPLCGKSTSIARGEPHRRRPRPGCVAASAGTCPGSGSQASVGSTAHKASARVGTAARSGDRLTCPCSSPKCRSAGFT